MMQGSNKYHLALAFRPCFLGGLTLGRRSRPLLAAEHVRILALRARCQLFPHADLQDRDWQRSARY